MLSNRDAQNDNSLFLTIDKSFRGTPEHPLALPKADVSYETIESGNYLEKLIQENNSFPEDASSGTWTTIVSTINPPGVRGRTALEVLQGVMVLKRILALNSTLPMTVDEFRVGRQIILPTETDLRQRFQIIDRDIAEYFYEVIQYYPEFEKVFRIRTRELLDEMR